MNARPRALQRLGEELERVAAVELTAGRRGRLRRASRRASLVALAALLLVLAAVATAAVLLIQTGRPLPAPHAQDLRSSGIPLAGSARLAGLDAPDPDSAQPAWDLRLSRTAHGETCTAVGQVLDGRLGIVGLDHVFRALPLDSVDSCGLTQGSEPILLGARDFIGTTASESRTVLSGVAGEGARSVTAYGTGAPRRLRLGPQGSFITVWAGAPEEVRPRVVIVSRDGRSRTIALEQSSAFEVPDPQGGSGWVATSEPDLGTGAQPDEDCAQVTREPSQREPSYVTLSLTPEVCGHLASSPLFVQMRRFVPGEDAAPYPWGNEPSRTIVYGVASPRVRSLTLTGAGATRALPIDRLGGAFVAVLDGHVDPGSLTLTATLRGGRTILFSHPSGLLDSRTNRPLAPEAVPAYRAPVAEPSHALEPFELPIASTERQDLHAADPSGGPEWVLRSWQGRPNARVPGDGSERYICEALGVLWDGRVVEPTATPSARTAPVTSESGRCDQAHELHRLRYMISREGFMDDPYAYAPQPGRTVISGLLAPGASHALISGVGPTRALHPDANDAFLLVLPGRYWNARVSISYELHGRRVGRLAGARALEGLPAQVRAPDPDGTAPWGFTASRLCATALGRVVAGRLATIDVADGALSAGPDITGSSISCLTHNGRSMPPGRRGELVEFDQQQVEGDPIMGEQQPLGSPEVDFRSLPGRTVISGVARADVVSVTLSTPSDVRTLLPTGPSHAILAVYDGYFLRGAITATVRLRGGRVESEMLPRFGVGGERPTSLAQRLDLLAESLAQLHRSERAQHRGHASRSRTLPGLLAQIAQIRARLRYERAHPGLLPAE